MCSIPSLETTDAGRNGCDVEIVIEFQPQAGGGLEMKANLGLESLAKETEANLRYSVKAYATDSEIIVTAGLKELREGQFLEPLACEQGVDVEIIRFSKSFVCKATGALVEAANAAEDPSVARTGSSATRTVHMTCMKTKQPTCATLRSMLVPRWPLSSSTTNRSCGRPVAERGGEEYTS